jgi:hypothetical protein
MPFTPKTPPTRYMMDQLYGTHDFKTYDDMPDFTPAPKPVKGTRKRNEFREYEDKLQKQIVKWFGLQYPHLEKLLAYNLNNSRNQIAGAINKTMGVRAGRNDLSLDYRGKALLLELKAPGKKQSPEQVQYEKTCIEYGNHYRVADNFDQATEIIRNFIHWCDK